MKQKKALLALLLIAGCLTGTGAGAGEFMTPPVYLERTASAEAAEDMLVSLHREIDAHIGPTGFELLKSINTRDGLIVLLRYFADNCRECKTAAALTDSVLPTHVTNYFLSAQHAVSPTLSSRLDLTPDDGSQAWEWFPETTIKPEDLGCLNCLGVHCP